MLEQEKQQFVDAVEKGDLMTVSKMICTGSNFLFTAKGGIFRPYYMDIQDTPSLDGLLVMLSMKRLININARREINHGFFNPLEYAVFNGKIRAASLLIQ